MARYIDVDEFRKKLFYTEDGKKFPDHDCDNFPTTVSLIYLHHLIRNFPTADVAPRSEVAREIFGELGTIAFTMHNDDSGVFILCMYCEDFEEIKQKYTEE